MRSPGNDRRNVRLIEGAIGLALAVAAIVAVQPIVRAIEAIGAILGR